MNDDKKAEASSSKTQSCSLNAKNKNDFSFLSMTGELSFGETFDSDAIEHSIADLLCSISICICDLSQVLFMPGCCNAFEDINFWLT